MVLLLNLQALLRLCVGCQVRMPWQPVSPFTTPSIDATSTPYVPKNYRSKRSC